MQVDAIMIASGCDYDCIVTVDGGFPLEEPHVAKSVCYMSCHNSPSVRYCSCLSVLSWIS